MTHDTEDYTAAKLKGHDAFIKFIDGEVLFITVGRFDDEDGSQDWFVDIENFLNGHEQNLCIADIAISRSTIKYIKRL